MARMDSSPPAAGPRARRRPRSRLAAAPRLPSLAAAVGLLLPCLLPSACGAVAALRLDPDRLPYRIEPVTSIPGRIEMPESRRGASCVVVDVDGDGGEQIVETRKMAVIFSAWEGPHLYVKWQHTLPPRYAWREPCASLLGDYDLDRDGRPEVVLTAERADRAEWHVWVLDPRRREVVGEVSLPVGPDLRPDGGWDGSYVAIGGVDVPGCEARALALVCHAGFDLWGRGVLAVDPRGGEILWWRRIGPDPLWEQAAIEDLDGDGRAEIAVATRATDNRGGALVDGHSDDSTMVYVLEADGKVAWSRALVPHPGATYLATGDLDADGTVEVVTSSWSAAPLGQLAVWSGADGRLLAERRAEVGFVACVAVPGAPGAGDAVVVGSHDRRLRSLRYRAGGLTLEAELEAPAMPMPALAADVVPGAGPTVVCPVYRSGVAVLAPDLEPLAYLPTREAAASNGTIVTCDAPGGPLLLLLRLDPFAYRVVAAPGAGLGPSLPVPALALVLTAGLAAAWWLRRRGGGPAAGPAAAPELERELRLQLLGRLRMGDHGRLGALRALRRLPWILEGATALAEGREEIESRLRQAIAEVRGETLPRLDATVGLARGCGVGEQLLDLCRGPLADLAEAVPPADAPAAPPDLARRLPAIRRAVDEAEAGFRRLRREAESWFGADLGETVAKVLAAHAEALRDTAVEAPDAGDPGPRCLVDGEHLEFVLDNLVDNAVRAMAGRATPRLRIGWRTVGVMVVCEVEDSGCGLHPEQWQRTLAGDGSTRPEGGLGLRRSAELLDLYGGSLRIVASDPGRGTIMGLTLPLALAARAQGSRVEAGEAGS